ncbi:phage holin [Lactococcus formosensis]|uniref:Phage holin n=2 Tax=Lactococcus formosensis TaxID=1281486 RepID=A0A9X4P5N5_9LACT|nr:phage holin [Lactococcus formosensis]MDG6143093.1 phage holin [Lactococcus formosensis]MDG6160341.1 phage holin [Lactococcus formosensis]MDG6193556.1 phage holin [Lactococcus formosensis]
MIMANKTYDVIKWVVLTVLPALSALVGVLGKAYGWEGTDLAVITLNAVTVFLGAITGYSAVSYSKKGANDE